jgi:hypothetical protein
MINKVIVTNHLGESITLELRFPEKSGFLVRDIDGLTPTKSNINITELATKDGAIFNSARSVSRNIVLSLDFMEKPTIEDVRLLSYKYFPTKRNVQLQIETDRRISKISGYVESNEVNIFSPKEGAIISIICPDAYLESLENMVTEFNGIESLFEFPFSNESLTNNEITFGNILVINKSTIDYTGDAPTGIIIYIHALGPAYNVGIVNDKTNEIIKISDAKLIALTGSGIITGDDIVISTVKGNKFITLIRNGVATNIRNALDKNVSWFQLERGENLFYFVADGGLDNLQFAIENKILYEGT